MPLTLAQMEALFNDNTAGDISAADGRSTIEALFYHSNLAADLAADPPDTIDDEFGDAKWTAAHAGNAPTWTVGADGRWYFSAPLEGGWALKTQTQAIPSGDWDIRCKVAAVTWSNGSSHKPCGLLVAEGTTAQKVHGVFLRHSTIAATIALNSFTSFGAETTVNYAWGGPVYFRVTRASTTYTWYVSSDGWFWHQVQTGTLAFTPTKIGIGGNVEHGTAGMSAVYDWFRRFS